MSAPLSWELDRLAFEFEAAREFRRLLAVRLAGVAAVVVVLSSIDILPWIAGDTALALVGAIITVAVFMERRARRRLMGARLARPLRQANFETDTIAPR